jgi:hypothetical protein
MTHNIVASTNYEWTLPVELKGQEYTEDGTDYMLYIILGVAVAITVSVIAAIIYYARRK